MLVIEIGRLLSGGTGTTVEDAYQAYEASGSYDEQQQELERDIEACGIREPLTVICSGRLIDGHHRYYAARRGGIDRMLVDITT